MVRLIGEIGDKRSSVNATLYVKSQYSFKMSFKLKPEEGDHDV